MQDNRTNVIAISCIGAIGIGALLAGIFAPTAVASEMPTVISTAVGVLGGYLGAQGLSPRRSEPSSVSPLSSRTPSQKEQ